jgi:hypothetical protein
VDVCATAFERANGGSNLAFEGRLGDGRADAEQGHELRFGLIWLHRKKANPDQTFEALPQAPVFFFIFPPGARCDPLMDEVGPQG